MAPVNHGGFAPWFTGATSLVTAGASPPDRGGNRPRRPREVGAYGTYVVIGVLLQTNALALGHTKIRNGTEWRTVIGQCIRGAPMIGCQK